MLAFLSMITFLWMIGHQFSATCAVISLFLAGVGQGTISIPSISAAYSSIPKARMAVANTALNIAQRVGGPVATTLLAVFISLTVHSAKDAQPGQFFMAFVMLSCLHLLTFGAATLLPLRIHRVLIAALVNSTGRCNTLDRLRPKVLGRASDDAPEGIAERALGRVAK